MKYFFILGNNPDLSVAEILSVIKNNKIKYKIIKISKQVLILDISEFKEIKTIFNKLGGSIKVGAMFDKKYSQKDLFEKQDILYGYIKDNTDLEKDRKMLFGFSVYKSEDNISKKNYEKIHYNINKLGFHIKKLFKQDDCKVRYVVSKEKVLSSVVITKNKLIEKGIEIVFFIDENKQIYFGHTKAVQDFEFFNKIDFSRPAYDSKSGMLPPKVANILINISQSESEDVIYDPFCGSGTILQQAVTLGYKNIIGSDISARAINDTKINLSWLNNIQKYSLNSQKIFKADVQNVSKLLQAKSVDCIITEPFLGPPLRGKESKQQIEKNIMQLCRLYINAFKEFKKILKPNGKMVIIIPAVKYRNELIYLDILSEIKEMGFMICKENSEYIDYTKRGSLIYSRPNQHVCREIFVFKNK